MDALEPNDAWMALDMAEEMEGGERDVFVYTPKERHILIAALKLFGGSVLVLTDAGKSPEPCDVED